MTKKEALRNHLSWDTKKIKRGEARDMGSSQH